MFPPQARPARYALEHSGTPHLTALLRELDEHGHGHLALHMATAARDSAAPPCVPCAPCRSPTRPSHHCSPTPRRDILADHLAERVTDGFTRWRYRRALAALDETSPGRVLDMLEASAPRNLPVPRVRRLDRAEAFDRHHGAPLERSLDRSLARAMRHNPGMARCVLRSLPPERAAEHVERAVERLGDRSPEPVLPFLDLLPSERAEQIARDALRGFAVFQRTGSRHVDVHRDLDAIAHLPYAEAAPLLPEAASAGDPDRRARGLPCMLEATSRTGDPALLATVLAERIERHRADRAPVRRALLRVLVTLDRALDAVLGPPGSEGPTDRRRSTAPGDPKVEGDASDTPSSGEWQSPQGGSGDLHFEEGAGAERVRVPRVDRVLAWDWPKSLRARLTDHLRVVIDDPVATVEEREAVLRSLCALPGGEAHAAAHLAGDDVVLREAAMSALGSSSDRAQTLEPVIAHADGPQSRAAGPALSRGARWTPPSRLGPTLARVLEGPAKKVTVRRSAARLLATYRPQEAVPALARVARREDEHRDVTAAVAAALLRCVDDPRALDALAELAPALTATEVQSALLGVDPDLPAPDVRAPAARVLATWGCRSSAIGVRNCSAADPSTGGRRSVCSRRT